MTENKQEFRRRVRISQPEVDEEKVVNRILNHIWFQQAGTIMAYCAIPPEIDLMPVMWEALSMGKTLLLPRCETHGMMTARVIGDLAELQVGMYGILEPSPTAEIFPPGQVDLVLVPGLAFDEKGRRLGRGKGYYDRFLTDIKGKIMGICRCLVEAVPVEQHDVLMDAVVTDSQIILCEMEDSPCLDGKKN